MGKLIGDADQNSGYGFSSTYIGKKAIETIYDQLKNLSQIEHPRPEASMDIC